MNRLVLYSDECFKRLKNSLKSYHQIDDPEILHTIRVELKKLKAVINLLQYGLPRFKGHKHYIPFRTIFRKAGEIRQPEVIYQLLLKYQIEGIADSQIPNADLEERLIIVFKKDLADYIKVVADQKDKLKKYVKALSRESARKYIVKRRRQLKRLLFPDFAPANLHKTRKVIKEIIFLDWVEKGKKSIPFLKKTEKLIGQWHDKQVLLGILNRSQYKSQSTILMAACEEDLMNLKLAIAAHYGKTKKANL